MKRRDFVVTFAGLAACGVAGHRFGAAGSEFTPGCIHVGWNVS